MHMMQLSAGIPSKLKLLWARFTSSRLTTIYFIFSICHCIIQVAFQSQAYEINASAADLLFSIVKQGNATSQGFPVLGKDLRMCDHLPHSYNADSCRVIWNGTALLDNAWSTNGTQSDDSPYTSSVEDLAISTTMVSSTSTTTLASVTLPTSITVTVTQNVVEPTQSASDGEEEHDDDTLIVITTPSALLGKTRVHKRNKHVDTVKSLIVDGQIEVIVNGPGFDNKEAVLDSACVDALNWPVQRLQNTKREDIVFIAFQFWVLGMSLVALLNESIPHIIASLLTHLLGTGWAAFQITHTNTFRSDFRRLTIDGACHPINLLPHYWKQRAAAEIPILTLNVVALIGSAFLTWRLIKLFGWQTFKRVGASLTIHRIYKMVLTLSITIQLSLFFMVVTVALWIDQIWNGAIGHLALYSGLYKGTFITTLILLVPWLTAGWFAVRRERKLLMVIFLVLCVMYMAGWGVMFVSNAFHWTFDQWLFFSLMASFSVVLTLASFILGVICRINFGKDLPKHITGAQSDNGDFHMLDGSNDDPEKVAFPSNDGPIPTYAVAFGDEAPYYQKYPTAVLGPRFSNPSAEPFEPQPTVQVPAMAYISTKPSLLRSDSGGSSHSKNSSNSSKSSGSSSTSGRQRWIIE